MKIAQVEIETNGDGIPNNPDGHILADHITCVCVWLTLVECRNRSNWF